MGVTGVAGAGATGGVGMLIDCKSVGAKYNIKFNESSLSDGIYYGMS